MLERGGQKSKKGPRGRSKAECDRGRNRGACVIHNMSFPNLVALIDVYLTLAARGSGKDREKKLAVQCSGKRHFFSGRSQNGLPSRARSKNLSRSRFSVSTYRHWAHSRLFKKIDASTGRRHRKEGRSLPFFWRGRAGRCRACNFFHREPELCVKRDMTLFVARMRRGKASMTPSQFCILREDSLKAQTPNSVRSDALI